MKLFLFGGAETQLGQAQTLKNLIKKVVLKCNPKQVLHIPFARLHPTEEEWKEGWLKELMSDADIEILDSRNENDVIKANSPLVFINGGHGHLDLINGINNNKRILDIICNAKYIVTESAGSMLVGEYQRVGKQGSKLIKALGILKKTIIEPHYTERSRHQLLIDEMKQVNAKYGVGIDSITALVTDPQEFPAKWSKIGNGTVEVKTRS